MGGQRWFLVENAIRRLTNRALLSFPEIAHCRSSSFLKHFNPGWSSWFRENNPLTIDPPPKPLPSRSPHLRREVVGGRPPGRCRSTQRLTHRSRDNSRRLRGRQAAANHPPKGLNPKEFIDLSQAEAIRCKNGPIRRRGCGPPFAPVRGTQNKNVYIVLHIYTDM